MRGDIDVYLAVGLIADGLSGRSQSNEAEIVVPVNSQKYRVVGIRRRSKDIIGRWSTAKAKYYIKKGSGIICARAAINVGYIRSSFREVSNWTRRHTTDLDSFSLTGIYSQLTYNKRSTDLKLMSYIDETGNPGKSI